MVNATELWPYSLEGHFQSSPLKVIAFLPFVFTQQLTLFSLQEGFYPEQQPLNSSTHFLHAKKLLKRECMETVVQVPFRACRGWSGGALVQEGRRMHQWPSTLQYSHTGSPSCQVSWPAAKRQNPSLTLIWTWKATKIVLKCTSS